MHFSYHEIMQAFKNWNTIWRNSIAEMASEFKLLCSNVWISTYFR